MAWTLLKHLFNLGASRRRESSAAAAVNDVILQNPVWRRVVLVGSLGAITAFLLGVMVEPPHAGTPDRVVYGLGAGILLGLISVLFFRPQSLRSIATLVIGSSGSFFVFRLAYLLFGAPAGTDIPQEMTENLFWVPVVYVMGYLIPGLTLGRKLAFGVNLLLLLVSVSYLLSSAGQVDGRVLLALAQLNLANWSFAYTIRSFSVYREVAFSAHLKGETMTQLAHTDALTGLANRLRFEHALRETLAEAARAKQRSATIFIDLDHFKRVNDTLGHAAGDELLTQVAQRLRQNSREEDLLARLGGDEFVLLAARIYRPQDAEKIAEQLGHVFALPFVVTGQPLVITASIGFCVFPDDGDSAELLLARSDAAMYQVKARGRAGTQRYAA